MAIIIATVKNRVLELLTHQYKLCLRELQLTKSEVLNKFRLLFAREGICSLYKKSVVIKRGSCRSFSDKSQRKDWTVDHSLRST